MSLETEIAALVTASNNLTGTVNGKIASIDARVNAALQTIIQNRKDIYVNAETGDDANSGLNPNERVKTLRKACALIPEGGVGQIKLEAVASPYLIDDSFDIFNKNIGFYGSTRSDGSQGLVVKIKNICTVGRTQDNLAADVNYTTSMKFYGSIVGFYNCVIETTNLASPALGNSDYCGLFSKWSENTAFLYKSCRIALGDTDLIIHAYSSAKPLSCSLFDTVIERIGYSRNGYLVNSLAQAPMSLSLLAVAYPSGLSHKDFVAGVATNAGGVPYNIISNVYFGA